MTSEYRLKCPSCGCEDFTCWAFEWAEYLICDKCGRTIDKMPVKKEDKNYRRVKEK